MRSLEAHGTGTALGDPIEVGAGAKTLSFKVGQVNCSSMKGHIGHAEAAAAGFGEVSLVRVVLGSATVGPNANLRRLNPHLWSYAANRFTMPIGTMS